MKRVFFHSCFAVLLSLVYIISFAGNPKYLVPYREGSKWGYCDTNGKVMISVAWDGAEFFGEENYAVVKLNNKYGAIDAKGAVVVKPLYDSLVVDNGIFIVSSGREKWGVVDKKGKAIVPMKYDVVYFSDANIKVEANEKTGLYNLAGKLIIPVVYDDLSDYPEKIKGKYVFGNYLLGVKGKLKYKISVTTGKAVPASSKAEFFVPPMIVQDNEQMPQDNGEFFVPDDIVEKLKQTFSPDDIVYIRGGYSAYAIKKYGKYAAVVFTGENKPVRITEYEFDEITFLFWDALNKGENGQSRYILIAEKNTGTGLVNELGKEFLPFIYDNVERSTGCFFFQKEGRFGAFFYEQQIKPTQPKYDEMRHSKEFFIEGDNGNYCVFHVLKVNLNGKEGYIGQNGVEYFKD
ncbi:MAG TPA: WG repeat-containing protein [Chitinophagaceae bacterium]|nr:WG repeat-containing protein [Chitinophagaceae bacterium]